MFILFQQFAKQRQVFEKLFTSQRSNCNSNDDRYHADRVISNSLYSLDLLFCFLFVNSLYCATCALIVSTNKVGGKLPWCDELIRGQIVIEAFF